MLSLTKVHLILEVWQYIMGYTVYHVHKPIYPHIDLQKSF